MTSNPDSVAEIERRLRRLHAGLDTSAAFAPALRLRIESLRVAGDAQARGERRALAYRERLATEAQLRRRFWRTLVITLVLGTAAAGFAWLLGAPFGRALLALGGGRDGRWISLTLASTVLFVGWLWLAVRSAARGGFERLAFG